MSHTWPTFVIRRSSISLFRGFVHSLRPWHVVGLIALAYIALTLARYGGDPMKFALVGTRYDPGLQGGTWGYDGQFAYQIARDPLGASRFLDVPAYRYQRILYPLIAWALAAVASPLFALRTGGIEGGLRRSFPGRSSR